MDQAEEIRKLAESMLAPGQFIVDVMVSAKNGPGKVLVLVDGDQGITIDDCAEISRQLSKTLDESSLVSDSYLLEVSTPGVDHPLKLKRQYSKNIGRKLKVKLSDSKVMEGKLTEVNDERIVLAQETGSGKNLEIVTAEVPFSSIEKAFVLVSFK
jgi:ribosome maturation factor RimP